jgi:hypothetical protein
MKRRDRPPGGRANRLRASAKLDVHFPPSTGAGQPLNDVGQGQEGDLAGTAAIGAKRTFAQHAYEREAPGELILLEPKATASHLDSTLLRSVSASAKWSLSGEKRTWRGHRVSVANDPTRSLASYGPFSFVRCPRTITILAGETAWNSFLCCYSGRPHKTSHFFAGTASIRSASAFLKLTAAGPSPLECPMRTTTRSCDGMISVVWPPAPAM